MANTDELLAAHLKRATNLILEDKIDDALTLLDGLHAKYPDHFGPCLLIAQCLYKLDRYEETSDWHNKAIKLSPSSAIVSTTKFMALFGLGKIDEALDEMERFLGVGKAEAYEEELSWWLSDLKQDDEKKDIYKRVLGRVRRMAAFYPPIAKVLEQIDD